MKYEYDFEPHDEREARHQWAEEWCKIIGQEISALNMYDRQRLFIMILEIRKRIERGDYSHPEKKKPPAPML